MRAIYGMHTNVCQAFRKRGCINHRRVVYLGTLGDSMSTAFENAFTRKCVDMGRQVRPYGCREGEAYQLGRQLVAYTIYNEHGRVKGMAEIATAYTKGRISKADALEMAILIIPYHLRQTVAKRWRDALIAASVSD